jgi:hypothetical protein
MHRALTEVDVEELREAERRSQGPAPESAAETQVGINCSLLAFGVVTTTFH